MNIDSILDSLIGTGITVRGREHVNGLLEHHNGSAKDKIVSLFQQGRAYGVYIFKDDQSFDDIEFVRKLGELGFNDSEAKKLVANLREAPPGETSRIESF